jgi:hypothetical protein
MMIKCFVATIDKWDDDCGTEMNERVEGAGRIRERLDDLDKP